MSGYFRKQYIHIYFKAIIKGYCIWQKLNLFRSWDINCKRKICTLVKHKCTDASLWSTSCFLVSFFLEASVLIMTLQYVILITSKLYQILEYWLRIKRNYSWTDAYGKKSDKYDPIILFLMYGDARPLVPEAGCFISQINNPEAM